MSRRRTNAFSNVQYSQLDQVDGGYADCQFQQQFQQQSYKIPWKAVTLAILLCFGGLFMLVFGSLIVSGHVDTKVCLPHSIKKNLSK